MRCGFFGTPQYAMPQEVKERFLLEELNHLTSHHRARCGQYDRILSVVVPGFESAERLEDLPAIPTALFKSHRLASVPESMVFKTLTSSGTTGQALSRVYLDKETAGLQAAALSKIMTALLGPKRLPMIVVDSNELVGDRTILNARATAILGMAHFGRKHFFALSRDMELDHNGLKSFVLAYGNEPFFIFGFTYLIWRYFLSAIERDGYDLSNGILLHGGGWKRLLSQSVDNQVFKTALREATGLRRVYNYYGTVEQVGSIFVEGDDGYLYPPNFADIIIRDPLTWQVAAPGQRGVIQLLSVLPRSYPGHSLLTEDMGILHGADNSPCGRNGKFFSVIGRVPNVELRGCGDTYELSSEAQDGVV